MAVLATDAATTNARSAQADARAALVAVIAGTMVDRNISQVEAAKICRRLIPLHPVTQYEGATQLSVGERVVGRESALCLGLSRVAPLRACIEATTR